MDALNKRTPCCKNCGHVIPYKNGKLECMKKIVAPDGICDRYQKLMTPTTISRVIDKKIKELEKYEPGQYKLTVRPPFHQNYHLISGEQSK